MRRRIKDANGNYLWFDNEEEYQAYLQAIRNSWPNKIKRFFYKVVAIIIVIFIILAVAGICSGQNKTKTSTEKTKTELNNNNSTKKSSTEEKSIGNSKKEEIQPEKTEFHEEESSVAEINATPDLQIEQSEEKLEPPTQTEEPTQETLPIEE